MYGLEQYLATTVVSKTHKEFIKLRASQINHCAFCIDMHSKDALKNGETTQRLLLLDAWRETDLFTEEEKAVLAITEDITLISEKGLTEETYQNALKYFSEDYIAQIIMVAVAINAWNRISVSTHIAVGTKF
ncbi:carboxymuconolactone decarboxylase family protein [Flectobacillus sp. DC10W]|uniref:Carboxymuconolactone decarboxylase family protein n=1 Tax=Flectobacillus longus TaxID=2984207 RepID=A0ABT6YJY5_9BACT|nr:carboxymuconolactone decarboxylase family protein [Flectobacillus longus]MDI9863903.1 carboxymuconolactone decarboxylase family protein [Flectobacillus longus]